MVADNTGRFFAFIRAREALRLRKESGAAWPWTDDPILRAYRFCNVNPEHDRVTRWIRAWVEPYAQHANLWIALALARFVNWPPTLDAISFPTVWDHWYTDGAIEAIGRVTARGEKASPGAYLLRGNGAGPGGKAIYTVRTVLEPMFCRLHGEFCALDRSPPDTRSLRQTHEWLRACYGVGGFMADLIVSDLRHTRYLDRATDIDTWAFAGPGAVRGLNRLRGAPITQRLPQTEARATMLELLEIAAAEIPEIKLELHAVESVLCELDKYERVRLGEGKPRARYVPGRGC